MENSNPKHNPETRRRNRGKWIGGCYIPQEALIQAKKIIRQRTEVIKKVEELTRWQKFILKLKKVWHEIKSKLRH